jgi:hypothetical protein
VHQEMRAVARLLQQSAPEGEKVRNVVLVQIKRLPHEGQYTAQCATESCN